MATVGGLRPTQSNNPTGSRKKGRTVVQRDSSAQVGLRPTAAPVDTYVTPGAVPQDNNLIRLSRALGELNPALTRMAAQAQASKEQDQMDKLRFYTEQFMKDKQDGAVNAAQVKEVFPELVPTVAARIAQATGEIEAKRWLQGEIQTILEDDNIRLNTENRQAYIEQIRAKALETIGENEFYGTGFLTQLDRSIGEFETTWMRETANHHEAVQSEAFTDEVVQTIRGGGDLTALDRQWKKSSSLNNLERNNLVLNAVTSEAIATNDPKLLDKIPDRFLNAESKATLAKTRQQIETSMYSQFVRAKEFDAYERSQMLRAGKVDILERLTSGRGVNPAEFYKSPELYEFAIRMNSQPTIDGTRSVRAASSFKTNLLRAGTTGSYTDAFANDTQFIAAFRGDGDAVSVEALRDHILNRTDMNPTEKESLLAEIPTLMDGVNFLRDPDTTSFFSSTVDGDLKVFAQSPQGQVLQTMGINAQGDVRNRFYETLRQEVNAYVEDKGEMPRGQARLEVLRRAEAEALKRLEYLQRNYRDLIREQAQGTSQPQPAEQPTNNRSEGDDTFITLPNGVKVKKVE